MPRAKPAFMRWWRPTEMLSSTLMPLNRARFWNVRPSPRSGTLVGARVRDVAALVDDAPRRRPIAARDAVQHRGLAGAVGADDGEQLAPAHLAAHVGQGVHAAEPQAYPVKLQNQRGIGIPGHRCGSLPSTLRALRRHRLPRCISSIRCRRQSPDRSRLNPLPKRGQRCLTAKSCSISCVRSRIDVPVSGPIRPRQRGGVHQDRSYPPGQWPGGIIPGPGR